MSNKHIYIAGFVAAFTAAFVASQSHDSDKKPDFPKDTYSYYNDMANDHRVVSTLHAFCEVSKDDSIVIMDATNGGVFATNSTSDIELSEDGKLCIASGLQNRAPLAFHVR